jgi:RNase P subunit RPR2
MLSMSQILAQRQKNQVLYSDLTFTKKTILLKSSAKEATCQFCKSELGDGNALTARYVDNKLVLMCSNHKF